MTKAWLWPGVRATMDEALKLDSRWQSVRAPAQNAVDPLLPRGDE